MANSLLSACLPRCLTLLGLRRGSCLSFRVVETGVLIIVGTSRIDLRRSVRPFSLYFDLLSSFGHHRILLIITQLNSLLACPLG